MRDWLGVVKAIFPVATPSGSPERFAWGAEGEPRSDNTLTISGLGRIEQPSGLVDAQSHSYSLGVCVVSHHERATRSANRLHGSCLHSAQDEQSALSDLAYEHCGVSRLRVVGCRCVPCLRRTTSNALVLVPVLLCIAGRAYFLVKTGPCQTVVQNMSNTTCYC